MTDMTDKKLTVFLNKDTKKYSKDEATKLARSYGVLDSKGNIKSEYKHILFKIK